MGDSARSEPIPTKGFDTRSHFHLRANRASSNRRVNAGETSSALAVQQNKDDSQNKKWCECHKYNFSHTTNECKVLAGKRKNVSHQDSSRANVSSTVNNENEIAQTFDYPATAIALFVRSTSENSFFIDCGATDHMVCTKTVEIPAISATLQNADRAPSAPSSSVQIVQIVQQVQIVHLA